MYILSQKLKNLKQSLKIWNKTVFGIVHVMLKEAEQKLITIQNVIDANGGDDALLEQHKTAQISLENALDREEAFWREKANISWHSDGDKNTKYFHRLTKIKNTSKMITSINDGENVLTELEQISNHIIKHFQNIFSSNIYVQDLQVN